MLFLKDGLHSKALSILARKTLGNLGKIDENIRMTQSRSTSDMRRRDITLILLKPFLLYLILYIIIKEHYRFMIHVPRSIQNTSS